MLMRIGFVGTGAITKAVVTGLLRSGLSFERITLFSARRTNGWRTGGTTVEGRCCIIYKTHIMERLTCHGANGLAHYSHPDPFIVRGELECAMRAPV